MPEALKDGDGYRLDVYIASHLCRKLMNLGSRLRFGYKFRNILTAPQIPRRSQMISYYFINQTNFPNLFLELKQGKC